MAASLSQPSVIYRCLTNCPQIGYLLLCKKWPQTSIIYCWIRNYPNTENSGCFICSLFPWSGIPTRPGEDVHDVWGLQPWWLKWLGSWLGWLHWCPMSLSSGFLSSPCGLSTSLAGISSQLGDLRVAEFLTWQPATLKDKKKLLCLLTNKPGVVSAPFLPWLLSGAGQKASSARGGEEHTLASAVACTQRAGRNGEQPGLESSSHSPLPCPTYSLAGSSWENFLIENTYTGTQSTSGEPDVRQRSSQSEGSRSSSKDYY